jgi:hypothetical protein
MTFLMILLNLHVTSFEMAICMLIDVVAITGAFLAYKNMKDEELEEVRGGARQ